MFSKYLKSLFMIFIFCSLSLLSRNAFADPAHMADAMEVKRG